MAENELIVRHNGKDYGFELTEWDADRMSDLTAVIEHAPFDRVMEYTAEQQDQNRRRSEEYKKTAVDFHAQLKRISQLDERQLMLLFGLLDLIELGEFESESNWALEFIERILYSVIFKGAAAALHQDPRGFLADLSHHMYYYWMWVRDSRAVVKEHPELFPAPPAEPEPAAESASIPPPANPRRAAKRGRKAA